MKHWTERTVDDFLYRITADFVGQLENKIESESLNKSELARKLGISKGRVSQVLNNPGNLNLKTIIRFARALGMKMAIVAYDDKDPDNERGPINADIFRICWENSGKPIDFWSLQESRCTATNVATVSIPLNSPIIYINPRLNLSDSEWQQAETIGLGQDTGMFFERLEGTQQWQRVATTREFDQMGCHTLH